MGEKPYKRRARQKAARLRGRAFKGVIQHAEVIDSLEFAAVFLVAGGRQNVGMPAVAYDCDLRLVDKGIAPSILGIGRDKATEFMRLSEEAVLIQARKYELRVKRGNRQARAVLEAFDSGDLRWVRMDSDDDTATIKLPGAEEFAVCQQLKSYLVGSSDLTDTPPLNEGVNQVVCFRGDDKRFYVGEETFDENSQATFVPLNEDGRSITYPSEKSAHRAMLIACESGEVERLSGRIVSDVHKRMHRMLRSWKQGEVAGAAYEEFTPETQISDRRERVTTSSSAARVRLRMADDLQYVADVGARQKLRIKPLTEIQLVQNRVDSE